MPEFEIRDMVGRLESRIAKLEREVAELKARKPTTPQYVPSPRYGPPPRKPFKLPDPIFSQPDDLESEC